ncbi:MAG: heme-binding protein [Mycobacterium sp.]
MNFSGINMRRNVAGIGAACLFGGLAAATVAAPVATAAPAGQCSASGLAGTASSVTSAARQYLDTHPGANQAVTAAMSQPRPEAEANLRGYFTANSQEYYELRGILAPIGDAQRTCNVTVLPGELASAYNTFMAG